MLFRGYIDESYGPGQNVFALSCILAKGSQWVEIERKWKLHLAAKNRELKSRGRPLITRYHASDCSGRRGEFEGWSLDERDVFVRGLFQVFRQVPTFTEVFDAQIDDVCEVFPETERDRLEAAYHWLTILMLIMLGGDFDGTPKNGSAVRFVLFHDRTAGNGKYDPTILRAFNQLKSDPTFSHRGKFTTIAPCGWEDCIALQPADLVAFECYKQAEARLAARNSRRSFEALLDMAAFGIHSKTLNKEALKRLKELVEAARQRRAGAQS